MVATGRKIAFAAAAGEITEIFKMDADGSNRVQLTAVGARNYTLDWSPVGEKIVFTHRLAAGGADIYVVDSDGENLINLTDRPGYEMYPAWSPDGSKIVYAAAGGLWVMAADGTNSTFLTPCTSQNPHPDWSPDGSKIVFSSWDDDASEQIFVVDTDGANRARLTFGFDANKYPAWSPDGSKIAYVSPRSRPPNGNGRVYSDIYVMDADGANAINLTQNPMSNDSFPSWGTIGALDIEPNGKAAVMWGSLKRP